MKRRRGYETIPMDEVVERYKEINPKGRWFSPDNTAFFASKQPKQAYYVPEAMAYFVTSERNLRGDRRLYTVRTMNWKTGEIDNVGPFNVLDRASARKLAQTQAEGMAIQRQVVG